MTNRYLAQLNIAKLKFAMDDPALSEFVDNLENINALADASPGFVWRLQTDDGDATAIDFFGPDYLVNMSVWEDVESLHQYVYGSAHNQILARRKEWFNHMSAAYSVLWWVPAGTIPTLEQAGAQLENPKTTGPGSRAFTFKQVFDPE